MMNNRNRPPMSRRKARLELKYRGTLRCEACGRHTEVPMEFYKKALDRKEKLEAKGKEFVFFCKRDRCLKSRPEGLVTPPKWEKDKEKESH